MCRLFSEHGQEELGAQVQARELAEQKAAAARGDRPPSNMQLIMAQANARALAAGREAAEGRRAQTSNPRTRLAATTQDLARVRDLLASEPLGRNASLVADSYLAMLECSGARPTSACSSRSDQECELGYWFAKAPLTTNDWDVDPVGLNEGKGVEIEGHRISLQVTVYLQRGKKRQDRAAAPGGEAYHLTPNAGQIVQCAPTRWLRLQMVRGLFAGCYSKLAPAEAAAMRARIRGKGFTGLEAAACGFADFEEMASACAALRWAKEADVGHFAAIPTVCTVTDAFLQLKAEDAQVLSNRITNAGKQLGYVLFGVWSVRKLGALRLSETLGGASASMWLGHAGASGREVYVRGAVGFEIGACYMRRPQAKVHVAGFASWRMPGLNPRCLWMVDRDSPVLDEHYTRDAERVASRRAVSQTNNALRLLAGRAAEPIATDGGSKMLTLSPSLLREALGRAAAVGPERQATLAGLLDGSVARRKARTLAETKAIDATLTLEAQRLRAEQLEVLRAQPEQRLALEASVNWPSLSSVAAVGFALERPVLTGAQKALRVLPRALQECVLECGALGLLKGGLEELQLAPGQAEGRSRLEKSELFAMACVACDAEQPLRLTSRTPGVQGYWRLAACDSPACEAVELDAMGVRCVLGQEAALDEALRAMRVPVVLREAYRCWRQYGGDAYSTCTGKRHSESVSATEAGAEAAEAGAGSSLSLLAEVGASAAAEAAEAAAEAAEAATAAAAEAALAGASAGAARKRPRPAAASSAAVAGTKPRKRHKKPQCPGQVRAAEAPVSSGAGLEEAAQSWLGSLNPEETREMADDWAFLQALQADDGPASQELV